MEKKRLHCIEHSPTRKLQETSCQAEDTGYADNQVSKVSGENGRGEVVYVKLHMQTITKKHT